MESSEQQKKESTSKSKSSNTYWKQLAFGFLGIIVFTQLFEVNISPRFGSKKDARQAGATEEKNTATLEESVLPQNGVIIPVKWADLGARMIAAGVIDKEKFESLYERRGGLSEYESKLLYGTDNGALSINEENAGVLLNLLWALGLSNKNSILEEGPMQSEQYGGDASRFASTGGWTLADGDVMEHYSQHSFIKLTEAQQKMVEDVSQNIYRPCCGNSVYFPDCNHGMAMLGLLELMASSGANEAKMYEVALKVNSYWFPDTYITLAKYFEKRGVKWDEVEPKEVLGSAYSGAQGYQQILKEIQPTESRSGGGCGV